MYNPLIFTIFFIISNIFIYIHEYAYLIICISEHWMKVLCLNIKLVPSLKVSYELLLRYEYFCRLKKLADLDLHCFQDNQNVLSERLYIRRYLKFGTQSCQYIR